MSLNTTPGALAVCTKLSPTRVKTCPAPVANQKRVGPWYSTAVMSSVLPDAICDQVAACAAGAQAPAAIRATSRQPRIVDEIVRTAPLSTGATLPLHAQQRLSYRGARFDRRVRVAGAVQRERLADDGPQPTGRRQRERPRAELRLSLRGQSLAANERDAEVVGD